MYHHFVGRSEQSDLHVGHAWVDSFKISGPGLSVSPKAKLTTTWGELKQQQ